MRSSIKGIKKGIKGAPENWKAIFKCFRYIGDIELNCEFGIYGRIGSDINKDKLGKLYSIVLIVL